MKHPGRGSWSPDGRWRHGDKRLASLHDFSSKTINYCKLPQAWYREKLLCACEQYLLLVGRNFKWAGPIMNCMNTIYRQLLLSTFGRVHVHSNPNICIYVMYVTTVNILLIYQCTMTYDESKTNKF